jgi:hypothetical protein
MVHDRLPTRPVSLHPGILRDKHGLVKGEWDGVRNGTLSGTFSGRLPRFARKDMIRVHPVGIRALGLRAEVVRLWM